VLHLRPIQARRYDHNQCQRLKAECLLGASTCTASEPLTRSLSDMSLSSCLTSRQTISLLPMTDRSFLFSSVRVSGLKGGGGLGCIAQPLIEAGAATAPGMQGFSTLYTREWIDKRRYGDATIALLVPALRCVVENMVRKTIDDSPR
jgi:hypothetical protein